jgi:hypothetical protein
MPPSNADPERPARKRGRPATSPEEREAQLIAKAYDAAEEQIDSGIASSQLLTHFVKAGSTRDALEKERLINENALLKKKIEDLNTAIHVKELLDDAMKAFKGYKGKAEDAEDVHGVSDVF